MDIKLNKEKTAILMVDPYNDFIAEGGKLWPLSKATVTAIGLIQNLQLLLRTARENGILIVYVPHRQSVKADFLNWKFLSPPQKGAQSHLLFEKGSWGGEFHKDLQPESQDLIAQQHWGGSGFAGTDLDLLLRMRGIDSVIIAGMRANTCIDTTARYAVELGYHVTLIADAIAAFNQAEIDATVKVNFPSYGHSLLSVSDFINNLKA